MEILSVGWRTDLALLAQAGSRVVQHPTMVVVSTPENPTFRWGNFLLLRRVPMRRDVPALLERFDELLPGLAHRAIGFDDPEARPEDVAFLRQHGLRVSTDLVLTTSEVRAPRHPNRAVQVRPLAGPEDWAQKVALDLACHDSEGGPGYELFVTRRADAQRQLTEEQHGVWFGAFDGARLLASLGVVRAGGGLVRYQDVQTHPEARGRGLAGTLLHAAGAHATQQMGATRLVIVADPDYRAIGLYGSVGFSGSERQVCAEMLVPGRGVPSPRTSGEVSSRATP